MNKTCFMLMMSLLLIGVSAFADDVSIDSSGNVETGVSNTSANLEVTGALEENAIAGSTSGTGAAGVYGENTTSGNSGLLGDDNYGVYGTSTTGHAGYFQGDAKVTGNLMVEGTITNSGIGDITGVASGTGMTGGGTSGDVTVNVDFGGTGSADTASRTDHVHSGSDITSGAVSEVSIDPAVARDSEIMPTVLSNDGPGSTLDADTLDGIDSTGFAASLHSHTLYAKVAIVAQSGGDYTNSLDAMSDIAAWCGTPGSTNPCLIRLMPGIYDLGNNGFAMQSYVDIEGSGENTTTITSTHSSSLNDADSATLSGADNAEIRFLTVENQGGSTYSAAIYNDSASPDITNVTAIASGGTYNFGVHNDSSLPAMTNVTGTASGGFNAVGVYNVSSSPAMTNVTANASGGSGNYGVFNIYSSSPVMTNVIATTSGGTESYAVFNLEFSSPAMTNVTATASGGTGNYGVINLDSSSPTIKTSSISGTIYSIFNYSSTVKVGATMLKGLVTGGGFTCAAAYDASFVELDSSCQPVP